MTRQPDLFGGFAKHSAKQNSLFDTGGKVSSLSCAECGEPMEHTPSGYLCCPNGHGKLREAVAQDNDASGSWFDDSL